LIQAQNIIYKNYLKYCSRPNLPWPWPNPLDRGFWGLRLFFGPLFRGLLNAKELINVRRRRSLNHNLNNSFVEKLQFIVKIYVKILLKLVSKKVLKNKTKQKNTFLILIQPKQNKNNNNMNKKENIPKKKMRMKKIDI